MSTKEMALVYPKSGVGWQASWRLKPRLGGQRVAKPAYAGWVLAHGSRRRPTSRRREPPSRRGFNRQLANPRFVVEPMQGAGGRWRIGRIGRLQSPADNTPGKTHRLSSRAYNDHRALEPEAIARPTWRLCTLNIRLRKKAAPTWRHSQLPHPPVTPLELATPPSSLAHVAQSWRSGRPTGRWSACVNTRPKRISASIR